MTDTHIQCPHCGTVSDWQIPEELAKHMPVFTADFFDRMYLEWQLLMPYTEEGERVTFGTYMYFELQTGRFPDVTADAEYIKNILTQYDLTQNRPSVDAAKETYERFKRG